MGSTYLVRPWPQGITLLAPVPLPPRYSRSVSPWRAIWAWTSRLPIVPRSRLQVEALRTSRRCRSLMPMPFLPPPYIYLIPAGLDSMRTPPLGDASAVRSWSVDDVGIPLPLQHRGFRSFHRPFMAVQGVANREVVHPCASIRPSGPSPRPRASVTASTRDPL